MTFQPGQSGNPAGRPRGSRNKRTLIAEKLFDDHAGDLTHAAIDLAVSGHGPTLRMCMDRIAPPQRHRLLDFDLPELKTAADAAVAANAIVQGVAHGEITIPEATGLMKLVRGFVAVLAAADREKRIARVEAHDAVDAARRPEHDVARDDDDRIIPAPCLMHGAIEATTTQPTIHEATHKTIDDGHDRPISPAPLRPCERAHDRAASVARSRRSTAPHGRPRDQRKSIVPTATSDRLGLFCAIPKTVEPISGESRSGCIMPRGRERSDHDAEACAHGTANGYRT
jgi:hypothetical protein